MGKFGLTEKYSKFGLADKYAAGTTAPQMFAGQIDQAAYESAVKKMKAGQSLTAIEQRAYTAMAASQKAISLAGVALQPFQAVGDVTRGVIQDVRDDITTGRPFTHTQGGNRGVAAAVGHVTYGASEYLPGQAGARANAVSGAELLKGTKWANSPTAAVWTEILTDPTILATGLGAIAKGGSMAAKLAGIENLAKTAAGRATISTALGKVSQAGGVALHLGDELTGLPTVIRGAVNTGATGVVKKAASILADKTLPPVVQRITGARTVGDAFYTPDVRAVTYTPEQLANQHFRDARTIASGDLGHGISTATVADAKVMTGLVKGLKPADATEVNRLLGVFTTATDPAIAAEALRKVGVISARTGRTLEPAFVDAVKAADRFSQVTIGRNLQAQNLPVILDPVVTKAVQEAQTGADLVAQIGKYTNEAGRPRGILMTQYTGRGNVDKVISDLNAATPTPASVTLDAPKVAATVEDAAKTVEVPPTPMQPTGTAPAGRAPLNAPDVAARVTEPVAPRVPDPAAVPPRSASDVMAELFGSKDATLVDAARAPDPPNVAPARVVSESDTAAAAPAPAPRPAPIPEPPSPVPDYGLPRPVPADVAPAPVPDVPPAPAGKTPSAAMADLFGGTPAATGKTPTEVLQDVLAPPRADPYIAPPAFERTAQDVSKDVGLGTSITPGKVVPERIVTKTVPTTYRTVQVDSSAVDWDSLPDRAARTEVQNTVGNGFRLTKDATGRWVPNKAAVTLPLDHPVVGRYFPNDAIEGARFGGDSAYGELTQNTRQQVPNWYNPKDPAPLDVQRATHEAEQAGRAQAAYPNDYAQTVRNLEGSDQLDAYIIGDAYAAEAKVGKPPTTPGALDYSANEYAARVARLNGTPPSPADVFRYRMALSRAQQAQRLQTLSGDAVATHLDDFFKANPEATLYEATLSAAKQFGVGTRGAKLMRRALQNEESGFLRQMSTLERKEFAQYIKGRDLIAKNGNGGMLTNRLLRNPEAVSEQFKQVFPQEENALKLLTEQAKSRTAAILKADNLRAYHDFLTQTGQHLTTRQLTELRLRPINQLSPEERALRESIAGATEQSGVPAGWRMMDRNAGPFQKGDAVPWWAHADLFGAGSIDDAAVSSRILQKGGLDVYNRLWSSMNAQLLSSPSSIINDQMGMLQQMVLWGVGPEQIINGMIRRAAAATNPEGRAMLAAMRENGIASAKLESNLGVERTALEGLARRLNGESDMGWLERNVDAFLRWREYGTGVDRGALSNPAAKVSSNVMHLGSAYAFQLRSAMSDLQRESLYFHYLSEGLTPAKAAGAANDVLMDMRLAPAYSRVVSKFWPFFRWTAMSAPRGILTVFRRPALSHTYQNIASLSDTATEDGRNEARRVLARDGGYINLGVDERGGARLYLDPRNWDVENTIPTLLDWSGTKVGSVGLPWYANLWTGVQLGLDRNNNNVFSSILGTNPGGWAAAHQQNPQQANILAAKYIYSIFAPSYAPGSSRSQALATSIVEAAKLPDDGSRDVQIAKTLMGTEWGQFAVRYMQQGPAVFSQPLTGNRGSPYQNSTPSMAASGLNFLFPIRRVNPDSSQQGDALQQLAVKTLELQNYIQQQKKAIAAMESGGASAEKIDAAAAAAELTVQKRRAALERLQEMTR